MRKYTKVLTAIAAAAAALTLAAPAAHADPINNAGQPITPQEYDVVGVGSDSIQYVADQLDYDYNLVHKTHSAKNPYIYSWDATQPGSVTPGGNITTKAGCAQIVRPDGSSAGVAALALNTKTSDGKYYCIDYARSSRARNASDPAFGPGGVVFVTLARDAVTYATTATSNAPANLTAAQLAEIYSCQVTDWSQLGGQPGTIQPFLPQSGSGTRAFFLLAIGVTTPGSCVNNSVQENEGTDPQLNSPDAIVPFSVGSWLAQKYHSAACGSTPTSSQNKFGCNATGVLILNSINGTAPYVNAGTKTNPKYVTNPNFTPSFIRTLYDVVRYDTTTSNHIPVLENAFFGPKGYFCTATKAKTDLVNYGFMVTPFCGQGS